MTEMTVEEIIDRIVEPPFGYDGNFKEETAELLRRFEALEKEILDYRGWKSEDNITIHELREVNEKLKYVIEEMRQ